MNDFTLEIFVDEIQKQSEYALTSYDFMMSNLRKNNLKAFWFYTSSFLSATANVSKLLGGNSKSGSYSEREQIRTYFNIKNDDLMIHVRDVRSAFDHYDNRIKTWSENVPNNIFISDNIGGKSGVYVQGMSTDLYMRNFEPTTGELSVLSDTINVYKAVEELKYFYEFKS